MPTADAEPFMPAEGAHGLENLTFNLARGAGELSGQLHPMVRLAVAELVRSVDCHYSNLIAGHDTRPRDIDRALVADYSTNPEQRVLQLEARAHIEVQRMIDAPTEFARSATTRTYLEWIHREFCKRLPESLLVAINPDTGDQFTVVPGELRTRLVAVGRHVAPLAEELPDLLSRFEQAYNPAHISLSRQMVAVAAAHHRFLWMHPFPGCNGRVARLMSHAMLLDLGVSPALWSLSRGLARHSVDYGRLLMAADEPRKGDLGRSALPQQTLVEFCRFFLESCLDQVRYMRELLQPSELQRRMELYVRDEEGAGRLPKRTFGVLREALWSGDLERGRVPQLIGASERTARRLVAELLDKRLLTSASPKEPLRLAFPIDVVERWFPRLYPGM